jgi:hypothetical protein
MRTRAQIACALLVALPGATAVSQQAPMKRIGTATRASLEHIIDSARVAGLPVAPLQDKVAEGVLKHADDERILRAVQALARVYRDARTLVGSDASPGVLGAAASLLQAGVPTMDIQRLLQSARPNANDVALESGFATLVDLLAKGVPLRAATQSTQTLFAHHAGDREFAALRAGIEQDALAGRALETAIVERTQKQVRALGGTTRDGVLPRRPPDP